STFVSSTKRLVRVLVPPRFFRVGMVWASVVADEASAVVRASDGFNKIKYLLGMTWDFDPAPFLQDDAAPVEHESAALYPPPLPAVPGLRVDDAAQAACLLRRVRQQLEREVHYRLEVLVGLGVVPRHAEHQRAGPGE